MRKEKILNSAMSKNQQSKNWICGISFFLFFLLFKISGLGQKSKLETENGMITSIAIYDADIRKDMLIACQNTNILSEIKNLRDKDQKAFQDLIKTFDQKKQGWFYELTRFPDFLQKLATGRKGLSKSEIKNMLPTQDATLEEAAWELYRNNNRDLVALDDLNKQINDNFKLLIRQLDYTTQAAFNNLSKYPDVLNFLTKNIEMAEKVGFRYAKDSNALMEELAEKHDHQIVENEKEMALYKQQLEDDPDAAKELSQATQDYAVDNGYILPQNRNYYIDNYYSNPYSFWFGYPTWYSSPMWYPGAYWNSFGFSCGLGGFGFYAFPSFGFSNWFYGGGCFNRYPSLYRRFGNYYNLPRGYTRNGRYNGFRRAANAHYSDRGNKNARGNIYASNTSNRNNSYGLSRGSSNSSGRNGNTSTSNSRNDNYSNRRNALNNRADNTIYNNRSRSSRNNDPARNGSLKSEISGSSRRNRGLNNSIEKSLSRNSGNFSGRNGSTIGSGGYIEGRSSGGSIGGGRSRGGSGGGRQNGGGRQ